MVMLEIDTEGEEGDIEATLECELDDHLAVKGSKDVFQVFSKLHSTDLSIPEDGTVSLELRFEGREPETYTVPCQLGYRQAGGGRWTWTNTSFEVSIPGAGFGTGPVPWTPAVPGGADMVVLIVVLVVGLLLAAWSRRERARQAALPWMPRDGPNPPPTQ